MKKIFTSFIFATLIISITRAQNTFPSTGAAGIGTTTPDASSLLEIKSTAKGFLPPRMTKTQRDAIATPATGLMIYQTNSSPGFYYYTGTSWKALGSKSWSLTGNAGTDSTINFIGTTDGHPLVFRVNNVRAGFIGYGKSNTSFGYNALISNTTGNYNTANGTGSLLANTTGFNNTAFGSYALVTNTEGSFNVANGSDVLHNNTTGNYNTANGAAALYTNTTGYHNTANGGSALYSNQGGSDNTATGFAALNANSSGIYNTANGGYALYLNSIGSINTAVGFSALYSASYSLRNTGIGGYALYSDATGWDNTAVGTYALYYNTGNNNTAVGDGADVSTSYNNSTAMGYNAFATASNQARIGSIGWYSDPTSIGGAVGWSTISDGRVKKNIKENVPGLAFIKKLTPVTYNLNLDAAGKIIERPQIKDKDGKIIEIRDDDNARKAKEQIVYTGFVAQDVEKAAKSLNYDFSGVDAAKNDKDLYGLRYADFVVPLVKAVQELSKINDDKDARIDEQDKKIDAQQQMISSLVSRLDKLEQSITTIQQGSPCAGNGSSSLQTNNAIITDAASLQQNVPNPFSNSTSIGYTLPQKFTNAQIVITDKLGKTLKTVNVSGIGKGSLNVNASVLASGAYQYSLIVDGKLIATKQMVIAK